MDTSALMMVLLTGFETIPCNGWMVGFGFGMFTGVSIAVMVVSRADVTPVSCTEDVQACVPNDELEVRLVGFGSDNGEEVFSAVDVSNTMSALEFMPTLTSSEEKLFVGRASCHC